MPCAESTVPFLVCRGCERAFDGYIRGGPPPESGVGALGGWSLVTRVKSSVDMGVRAFKEGRIPEAIVFLEYAAKFHPDNHRVWLMLARAYQKDGQPKKAAEAFTFVISNSSDPELALVARQGLGSLDESIQNEPDAPTGETSPPLECPECGSRIPAARRAAPWCMCGWGQKNQPVLTAKRIYLQDIIAYCRRRGVRVSMMHRGDLVTVGASDVRIQGMGTRTYPVNPRLIFPAKDNLMLINQDDLEKVMSKVSDDALFRERAANDDFTMGKLFNWRQFVARLSETRGYDVTIRQPDLSLAGVLAANGVLDAELVSDTLQERNADQESVGQTLLRLGLCTFEQMVSGAIGDIRLIRPGSRPFPERLGNLLLASGAISIHQLKQALFLQTQIKRPLGEVLEQMQACTSAQIQQALKSQRALHIDLPEADMLGELLIARKKITRTDMLIALADEQSRMRVPLGEVLINLNHITHADLQSALGWQSRKRKAIQAGQARLGDILIDQRALSPEGLGQALMRQIDDPRPLGQLLIDMGTCTPEQIIAGLEEQITRRNRIALVEGGEDAAPAPVTKVAGVKQAKLKDPTRELGKAPTKPLAKAPAPTKPLTPLEGRRAQPKWIVAAVLVLALLGGGAWFMFKPGEAPPAPSNSAAKR